MKIGPIWLIVGALFAVGCGSGASASDADSGAGASNTGAAGAGGRSGEASAGASGAGVMGGASGGSNAGGAAGACSGTACVGSTPLKVSLGAEHGCGVTAFGGAKCWGKIGPGQLGNGRADNPLTEQVPAPVDVIGLTSGVIDISAGGMHSCALTKTFGVKCWGLNNFGQLGDGTTKQSNVPVDVSGLSSGVVEVAAGYYHTCAKLESGILQCWGENRFGQLGDGTGDESGKGDAVTPREVPGLGPVRSFSVSTNNTCAVTEAGSAKCWGANSYGQLGDGTFTASLSPVDVVGLESGVAQISVSGSFACAVTEQGAAKCWGGGMNGHLGNGSTADSLAVVDVTDLASGVALIRAGATHSCALMVNGTVKCWGYAEKGQVGSNLTGSQLVPFLVPNLTNVSELSVHSASNCVVTGTPPTIKGWGSTESGELGTDGSYTNTPVTVPGF